jgi:hypothetical protein
MPHLRQLVEIEKQTVDDLRSKADIARTSAILYTISLPLALAALVFLPAGGIDWTAGWIFVAVFVAAFGLSALLLARVNPMIYRARSRFQPGDQTAAFEGGLRAPLRRSPLWQHWSG